MWITKIISYAETDMFELSKMLHSVDANSQIFENQVHFLNKKIFDVQSFFSFFVVSYNKNTLFKPVLFNP